MSLNGLDSQPIQDAYQTAITEPGGWFLMKYCSRDAVDLLSQGKSGVNGARNAIAQYEEASPLYGLLIYRRRRVLIKFIPDGTSRLLQARTAVHFQDVLEKYSPYETLLEISNSESLNDTSLASAFPLHTASASPAASSNRLHEISEDAEDGGGAPVDQALSSAASAGNAFGAQRYRTERTGEQIVKPDRLPPSIRVTGDAPPSPASSPAKKAAISQFLIREDLGHTSIRPLGSAQSIPSVTEYAAFDNSSLNRPDSAGATDRLKPENVSMKESKIDVPQDATPSSQFEVQQVTSSVDLESDRADTPADRPSISDSVTTRARTSTSVSDQAKYDDDPYDLSKFEYKPKVKVGPRWVASTDVTKRPTTASIAGVPSHYRPAPKKQEPTRPSSQGTASIISTASATHPALPAPPPIPAASDYNPRPVSRGSVKSMPTHKSTAMTPDKIRLMKAVELRKRQLRKSTPQESFQPPKEEGSSDVPPVPEILQNSLPEETRLKDEVVPENHSAVNKADSGIGLHYDKTETSGQTPVPSTAISHPVEANLVVDDGETTIEAPSTGIEPVANTSVPRSNDDPGPSILPPSTDAETAQDPFPTEPEPEEAEDSVEPDLELTPVPTIVMGEISAPQVSVEDGQFEDHFSTAEEGQRPFDDDVASIAPSDETSPISTKHQGNDLARRRRGVVEPLHIDVSPSGNPDDFISDDEDFLEELRTAPVEQAKPVQVAKPPALMDSPGRRPSTASGSTEAGTSVKSIRIKKSSAAIADKSLESASRMSPEPSQVPHYTPTGMWEKYDPATGAGLARNVSSGISKRIQRLAEVSSRESISSRDNGPSRPLTPDTSPNAFLQRDQRERNAMVRNAHKARPVSFRRQSSKSSGAVSPSPISPSENAPIVSVQRDAAGNRNSVSVTARIVRPNAARDAGGVSSKFQPSELKISTTPTSPQRRPSYTQAPESVTSSTTSPGALSPPLSPISPDSRSVAPRFGRKQSTTSPSPEDFPPPPTSRSGTSPEESASTKEGGSRTSRFFKRMSNFGNGGKRKSGPQRTSAASSVPSTDNMPVRVSEPKAAPPVEKPDTPPAVVVGDLNVQFPDSLLWKRRIVTIDETGNLQFAIAQAMDIHKSVAVKKFHLADFKLPYAPDLDYQELPHSVVLEFSDGTTLQIACEDSMTHRQVLHLLKTHWKAWAQPS